MIALTDSERERFAAYLEQEAATMDGLIEQMRRINVPEALIKHKQAEAYAQRIMAKALRNTETVNVRR